MKHIDGKKLILLGVVFALLAIIPLTIFLVQQQQETRSRASKSTNLYFSLPGADAATATAAATLSKSTGDTFDLDIIVAPGTNVVTFIRLEIDYDPTKVELAGKKLAADPASPLPAPQAPTYEAGKIFLSFGASNGTQFIEGKPARIATVTFKALAPTTAKTTVSFGEQSEVLSKAAADQADDTVLSGTTPVDITIADAVVTPTPSATPSATLTPTVPVVATATPTVPAGTQVPNAAPVCAALNLDRTPSGTAPFSITFTAVGTDSDGTINKVTFNYGDGPVQDILQAGGIGTGSVSSQSTHTYNNGGTFRASAILTDSKGSTSLPTACTQTITVTAASGSATTAPTTVVLIATPTTQPAVATATSAPRVTTEPPGPGETLFGIGAAGIILSIIGGLLFLAL